MFLSDNGNSIKLGDLNVSKVAKKNFAYTQTGTPYYLSPEVWRGEPYNSKCDVWSLGCVIFYLYSRGHKPWERAKASLITVLLYNKEDFFAHVENSALEIVAPIRSVLDACLKHDHHERCSVTELK